MPPATSAASSYHQRVQQEKRAAILEAATGLFLADGYDGTSLAKVAAAAGVSTATLFKRFPTKADLFDAIVTEYWAVESQATATPAPGDPRRGLTAIGRDYVALLTRPQMVALFRLVIAEAPRFPELAKTHFALGKLPYFDSVRDYLRAEQAAGTLRIADTQTATTQFLGMVSNFAFWPRLLLPAWSPTRAATRKAIDEAVATMLARYGASTDSG
ncbi:TetR/AcrR family transcriptional regulator [Conexibacter stalactiti]|uniref:TetR/AcrR family transcriptional regulator n=1 Tax=Conexibacter stalactiti TaxID=1940611 RepID=A0ABU4HWR5_9ACTN|nr:TetR/AcrR family transcriptional regulator [Conexibacter stalactiti]MDW5597768.1 TetR/AcrR family transcriptional regulator [Conexibacter stalactiti]MEC5038410.1 TetR/AcrR family transcriptional regulator [Conexibacter stalactiti]